ncbi:hypothetical protein PIB30_080306 [Stylosanthes scabra]|uniref:Ubiquitin-like protease family profile domain-containing protein n=1 Tax=Stylosanthes scabra TaxID=79078 RepID=A0ABU6YQC1_9FABA|nr:hypothetical protein [Stylosanthes scabra]
MGQDKGQKPTPDSPHDPSIPSFSLNIDWSRPLGTQEQPPKTLEDEFLLTARTIAVIESMDKHVVSLMCHVLNTEEDEQFEKLVYCVPPEILQRMFDTHHHNWMDKKKKKPHDISTLKNHEEYLIYLDREKLLSHRFLFAPMLYSEHWWLYVLDKSQQEMFVLDSKNISSPTDERTALNKFAMELIDPTILAGCCTYNIEQWTEPMLEEFMKKLVVKIIMSKENSLRADAIKGEQNTRVTKHGAAL